VDCEQIQELLSEYADDQLSPEARGDVEAHVAACKSCAGELASLHDYLQAMHDLRRVPAPADFVDAVNRRLDACPVWRKWVSGILPPFFSGTPLRAAGLIASVLIVILVTHQMSMREKIAEFPAPVAHTTAEQKSTERDFTPGPTPPPPAEPAGSTPDLSVSPPRPVQEAPQRSEAFVPSSEPPATRQSEASRDKAVRTPTSPKRQAEPQKPVTTQPIELTIVLAPTPDSGRQRTKGAPWLQPGSAPSERSKDEARLSGGTLTEAHSAIQESESSRPAHPEAGVSSSAPPASDARKSLSPSTPPPAQPRLSLQPERKQLEDSPGLGENRSDLDVRTNESQPDGSRQEAGKRGRQAAHVQQAIESLRQLLSPLSGTIVAIEKTGEPPRSSSVTITIPAHHYPRLIRDLATLGTTRASQPQETVPWSTDPLSVRVVLVPE
jgi:hypothetical protein